MLHLGISVLRRVYSGRHPLGSMEEVRGIAGTTVVTAAIVLAALLPIDVHPVPASTPAVGAALALLMMLSVRFLHRHQRDRTMRPPRGDPVCLRLGEAGRAGTAMLGDPKGAICRSARSDDDRTSATCASPASACGRTATTSPPPSTQRCDQLILSSRTTSPRSADPRAPSRRVRVKILPVGHGGQRSPSASAGRPDQRSAQSSHVVGACAGRQRLNGGGSWSPVRRFERPELAGDHAGDPAS